MLRQCLLILFLFHFSLCYKIGKYSLLMPNVRPNRPELYLCTPVKVDNHKNYFIIGFEPNATMETAHHMLLYGCTTPGSVKPVCIFTAGSNNPRSACFIPVTISGKLGFEVAYHPAILLHVNVSIIIVTGKKIGAEQERNWDCGEMANHPSDIETANPCEDGTQIIYAWARDAPKLELPYGVGFKVGKDSPIKYLVLQVHYAHIDKFKGGKTDDSGVFLEYTERPLNKLAGVLLLGTRGVIAPGKKVEHMETSCTIKEDKVIHPFAYRTHTHSLGLVVSGYKVVANDQGQDTWTLLGKRSPQTPQMFYPVENTDPIKKNDIVAARCTMKSRKDKFTYTGATNNDEMCNFYLMYYVEDDEPLEMKYCFSDGPPYYYWFRSDKLNNIPDVEASQL